MTIAILSIAIGALSQTILHRIDLKNYPTDYSEYVEKYSDEYGVPQYIAYAVIKYESSFKSNAVGDDGGIGLMGITADRFDSIMRSLGENLTSDALYGPETNIRYGMYELSELFSKYESWNFVLCAKAAGAQESEGWLADLSNYDENGTVTRIPESGLEAGERLIDISVKYRELYFEDSVGQ